MTRAAADATVGCLDPHAVDMGFAQLTLAQVVVLGIVQGITELLPISSTAHLRVIPGLLGWRDPGSAFSAAMQLASFAAVIVYFWKDIRTLVAASGSALRHADYRSHDFRLLLGIVIGTIPLVIVGAALRPVLNACHSPMRGLTVVAVACIVMSLLLALAEKSADHRRALSEVTLMDGILVGIAQAFAVIPGVSRSGATLTAALFCGMQRETAARFSFLLGLPAITLAGFYELYVLLKAGLSSEGWMTLVIGLACASVTAFFAIYGLLHYLERRSTWIFVWYRLLLGIALLAALGAGLLRN